MAPGIFYELAEQIEPFIRAKGDDPADYHKAIFGIEKEYRLSKVANVSAFMSRRDLDRKSCQWRRLGGSGYRYGEALSGSSPVEQWHSHEVRAYQLRWWDKSQPNGEWSSVQQAVVA